MKTLSKTLLLASALSLSVAGPSFAQVEGDVKVETEAGTVITGDKAQMTKDGVTVKGEEVVVKTDDTITVAQDGEATIKDNKIEVMGDTVGQQTTKAKNSITAPEMGAKKMMMPESIMKEGSMKDAVKSEADSMIKKEAKKEAEKAMKKKAKSMMKNEDGSVQEIDSIIVKDTMQKMPPAKADVMMESSMGMEPMTDAAAPMVTQTINIACPAGTTAQPNGTCMITGDYKE